MKNNFIVMTLILVSGISCKKECYDASNPACVNYDPCLGYRATAAFQIRQYDGWYVAPGDEAEFCDTILQIGAEFIATMPNADSYSWKIGTDTRTFTGKKVQLKFSDFRNDITNNINPQNPMFYNPIKVTLTVRNKPSSCITGSDTVVTFSKNLVFTNKWMFTGKFIGKCDIDNVERTIELTKYGSWIDNSVPNNQYCHAGYSFINLPLDDTLKMCGGELAFDALYSWKQWWWQLNYSSYAKEKDGISNCHFWIEPKPNGNDILTMKYTHILKKDNSNYNITFKGIKIP